LFSFCCFKAFAVVLSWVRFFFSFTSSHSSRVVCEGILRNLHLGTCCDKRIHF
jgi:hypothetical protein